MIEKSGAILTGTVVLTVYGHQREVDDSPFRGTGGVFVS
jgi:hypothetical protein